MSQHLSLPKDKIRFLLLEGVHQNAVDTLNAAGYTNIDYRKTALEGEALKEAIKDAHFIGIRSRTQLTEEVFEAANKLIAVGCFCIGTNQVEHHEGVFHAPWVPCFNDDGQCPKESYPLPHLLLPLLAYSAPATLFSLMLLLGRIGAVFYHFQSN